MKNVFVESTNIISSLGFSTSDNVDNILNEISGIQYFENSRYSDEPIYLSVIDPARTKIATDSILNRKQYTRLEKLIILSLNDALSKSSIDIRDEKTLLILSSTKGNVDLLDQANAENFPSQDVNLWQTTNKLSNYFALKHKPVVVSHACISGVVACIMAKRLIDAGKYENVVVVGADTLSKFVVSGFQSFKSLSPAPCKPFDAKRDGLNLGEGVATIIFTSDASLIKGDKVEIVSGAVSNDANHISGPSRTGEGLFIAIQKTLTDGKSVDFVSAHGTATLFNDDMESKALSRSDLSNVPVIGIKGYIGHTLGAAGVIEIIAGIESMKRNVLINTLGYSEFGVAEPITISSSTKACELKSMLKIASGFGGCNAAALFRKHDA